MEYETRPEKPYFKILIALVKEPKVNSIAKIIVVLILIEIKCAESTENLKNEEGCKLTYVSG